jgi:hypothetical protein
MKTQLATVISFALWAQPLAASSGAQMKSIGEFLAGNSASTNGSSEVFVGLRCHALYTIFSVHFDHNSGNDLGTEKAKIRGEVIEQLKQSSAAAINFALENRNKATSQFILGQSKIMIDSYADAFATAKARTGSGVDDPVIAADLKTCGELFGTGNQ